MNDFGDILPSIRVLGSDHAIDVYAKQGRYVHVR